MKEHVYISPYSAEVENKYARQYQESPAPIPSVIVSVNYGRRQQAVGRTITAYDNEE